ncbi:MAG TPA: insulinase family protein [Desulfuromonadales bacterium]|nr:insulinase family protein [Desulfuromonadales bacterium]
MSNALFQPGTRLDNYCIQLAQPLPELNLTLIQLRHEPTGARHVHLACDDPNNVFAVGFRTPPPDSTGVAHILEHTVLCGSQRYPVRDPFFTMLKRSLNTFMNAMTAADWTFYPIASMNRKDFDNLMSIYLDAAFFPLLRENDFRQEGHRLEFHEPQDANSPLTIRGVVFNEMKGAMADPSSLLSRRLTSALFPTTCYGHNSGGEPQVIPELTWGQLRDFHHTFYHPSNSWFFTYGNLPLEEHLAHIEERALSRFDSLGVDSTIPREIRFDAPRQWEETFPVASAEDLAGRSLFQVGWLTSPIEDSFACSAMGILTSLLIGNPAAPLYQALLDSKLGQNLCPGVGYHGDYRDTFFAAGLQGTDPDKTGAIEELILETLQKVADQGFPAERVAAALHQYEFSHREVSGDQYPYGLHLLMRMLGPWLHADDPLSPLQIEENLKRLRQAAADPGFFPDLIHSQLLDNPHRVKVLLRPDPDHARREEESFNQRLQKIENFLSEADRRSLVAKAEELKAGQETPEDLDCLPNLDITDIDVTEESVAFTKSNAPGPQVYRFDQPTNGITYLTLQFDIDGLPDDLQPYLPLFCALLPQIGAAGQDYLTMARRISAVTGGIRLTTNLLTDPADIDKVRAVIDLKGKALTGNLEDFGSILTDLLCAPDFSDLGRLKTVIGQVKTSMENSIAGSGHSYAARSAASSLTPAARRREEWSGISQLLMIREAAGLDDEDLGRLAETFQRIARHLIHKQNLAAAVTAQSADHSAMQAPLLALFDALPAGSPGSLPDSGNFSSSPRKIGWSYNLPVAYVAKVFRTLPYVHPDAPLLMVLAKLLRANYLHREIREKGGAYGGLAGNDSEGGLFSLLSYRDPHLVRTLQVYRQAVDWAASAAFSDEMVQEAILAVFGELDRPLSPGGRGYREFLHQRQGLTLDMRQALRNAVLQATRQDIARVARLHLAEGWDQGSTGVLAGEAMFQDAEQELQELGMEIQRL